MIFSRCPFLTRFSLRNANRHYTRLIDERDFSICLCPCSHISRNSGCDCFLRIDTEWELPFDLFQIDLTQIIHLCDTESSSSFLLHVVSILCREQSRFSRLDFMESLISHILSLIKCNFHWLRLILIFTRKVTLKYLLFSILMSFASIPLIYVYITSILWERKKNCIFSDLHFYIIWTLSNWIRIKLKLNINIRNFSK